MPDDDDRWKSRIVTAADGTKDVYRPGSLLFGSLAPMPEGSGLVFRGVLPYRPIAETGYIPSVEEAKRSKLNIPKP